MAAREDVRNGRKAHTSPSHPSATGLWEAFQRWYTKTHSGDYLGLIILLLLYTLIKALDEPFHRLFRLSDPRIQLPHAENERVPVFLLFLYCAVFPAGVLAIWTLIVFRDLHKAHVSLLGLAGTLVLTALLTDIFKDAVGRPRPDLLARCKPAAQTPVDKLVGVEVCTETRHHLLHDGWRSFPSGHSSLAFAGLGWLSLFLAAQMKVLQPRASLLVLFVCFLPLIGAGLVACSRLEDYRHDVFDVTVGSLLGISIALLNWRRFYPGLMSRDCDEPYTPPSSGRTSPNSGFRRVRDEEEGIDSRLAEPA